MNSRLESLINRGYDKDEVIKLASFTEEELKYASEIAFNHISRNCTKVDNPNAIFIGGQPGCGKTVLSMNLKNNIKNIVEIGIDNYRMYHPRYLEIEKCIRKHWENREVTENDSPGNDIADFTHWFAGAMTDKLIEKGKNNNYNLLLEWGMREPNGPLNCMSDLKDNNYNNTVLFVSTYKDISYEACKLRANIMKNTNHIIRKVPKSFHDYCIETLPDSIKKIYNEGYNKKIIDYMAIITRKGKVLWDDKSKNNPGNVYRECVNNKQYYENLKNNSLIALQTIKEEMIGLKNQLQQIVLINPSIAELNNKKI